MTKVLLIGREGEEQQRLIVELRRQDCECALMQAPDEVLAALDQSPPDLVVVNLVVSILELRELRDVLQACGGNARIPTLALVGEDQLTRYDLSLGFDDFQLFPCRPTELAARVRQALWRTGKLNQEGSEVLRCGDLVINTSLYEVHVAGHPVELTFKEYELLRFLAANQDKVFTRETLLNRVWGYDYYGGARTVDVHIRRLRSKIEDKDHSFIETVRNVGYRCRPSRAAA